MTEQWTEWVTVSVSVSQSVTDDWVRECDWLRAMKWITQSIFKSDSEWVSESHHESLSHWVSHWLSLSLSVSESPSSVTTYLQLLSSQLFSVPKSESETER